MNVPELPSLSDVPIPESAVIAYTKPDCMAPLAVPDVLVATRFPFAVYPAIAAVPVFVKTLADPLDVISLRFSVIVVLENIMSLIVGLLKMSPTLPFSKPYAMLCITPVRNVCHLGPSCSGSMPGASGAQAFIQHGWQRGYRTHEEWISA